MPAIVLTVHRLVLPGCMTEGWLTCIHPEVSMAQQLQCQVWHVMARCTEGKRQHCATACNPSTS